MTPAGTDGPLFVLRGERSGARTRGPKKLTLAGA